MGFYDEPTIDKKEIVSKGEKVFYKQFRSSYGIEGFTVKINENFEKDVIIQQHTNPMNELLEDKKMVYIPSEDNKITWGCVVSGYNNSKYLVITEPHTNGIYDTCKIREMLSSSSFCVNGQDYNYDCIKSDGKLYNDSSYTGETTVFEDDDMKAMIITYDDTTASIKLFDDILVDGQQFKVVKIDNLTLKRYKQSFGVLQITILRTIFGEIKCNDTVIDGCLRFSKMKEKIYNSKARQLYTNHNTVETGDYIHHTFDRDELGNKQTRTYMVYSEVDMKNEYDTAFCLLCDRKINLLDENGNISEYSMYVNDNKSMLRESSIGIIDGKDTSSTWASIKLDKTTMKMNDQIQRILVKHYVGDEEIYKAYRIIGKDNLSLGGVIIIALQNDKIDNDRDDLENGIAYNENSEIQIPKPTSVEISGHDKIYMDLNNTYTINSTKDVTWSVSESWIDIVSSNNKECKIFVKENKKLYNKKFILTATTEGKEYTKTIKIIN